mgnify:CR=1 FL=1|tara:strand:- start:1583 stop:2494 length:912 start_codon:yes stop_codon:yes gene_type:complete
MSTIKISALPSGNPAQSGDEIPIARGGTSYKITAGSIADLGGNVSGPASSVNNQIALFAGTAGDSIQAASTTGLLKASSGVIAAAVLGVDYGDVSGADTISTDNAIVRFDGTTGKLIQKSTAGVTDAGFLTANGLTFPAVQVSSADVNTLDDYEEGTWTPNYMSNDIFSGDIAVTYVSNTTRGRYRKIGAVVFIEFSIVTASVTVTGATSDVLSVEGLPFAPISGFPLGSSQILINQNLGWTTAAPAFGQITTTNLSFATGSITLSTKTSPDVLTPSSITGANLTSGSTKNTIYASGFYFTAT